MGYVVELWRVYKNGITPDKFMKKATFDFSYIPQYDDVIYLSNRNNTHEIKYKVYRIRRVIYSKKHDEYNSSDTEFYFRIYLIRA